MNFQEFVENLETKIKNTYLEGISIDDAEKLAAEFLHAQMIVSTQLSKADLDSRMKKAALKAIRSAAYIGIIDSNEKKPTEAAIEAMINTNPLVSTQQDGFDDAEVDRDELQRYYQIFRESHIYYRGISKGKFE